ncbi:MAG: HAD family phosphatase [Clostridia bacterium]|nr:HAD family phosphatase [Clostridia bacterium]
MKKYLIIFDLDGTVLPTLKELNDRTVEAVKAARAAGHIVCISSARPFSMFRWVYDRMGLDTAISTINGAHVYHPSDPSFPEIEITVPQDVATKIFNFCAAEDCNPYYAEKRDKLWYTDGIHNGYYREHIKAADPLVPMPKDGMLGVGVSRIIVNPTSREVIERLRTMVEDTGVLTCTVWEYEPSPTNGASGIRMSIAPKQADKGEAMKHIAAFYGIPLEECYAFGDMWNDFGMLRAAGHGYALKGSDAEYESGARFVTRYTCEECGVADIIEREILGIQK